MLPSLFFFFFFCCCCCFGHPDLPIVARRILHQPFFPLDKLPPSQPPSPSPPTLTPKFPFSDSSSTPTNSPFFPTFPSPPPPPSPSTFASFPANISSLILPHSTQPKPSSHKLFIVAISAVISAALVAALLLFFYIRRRKHNPTFAEDDKTLTSQSSARAHPLAINHNADARKLRTTSTTSSEFLYLGTLVNSRQIDESSNSRSFDGRKMESPELQPLPPLARQSAGRNLRDGEMGSATEEEEDFYSPRGSLGGREVSSVTGSGSRRVFAGLVAEEFQERSSESSSSSCSSSTSGSPARSHSVSISPPVSLSPRRLESKSPESPQPQQQCGGSLDAEALLLPRNVRSSTISLVSTSPERAVVRTPDDQSVRSPSLSPISTLHDTGFEKNQDASPRLSLASDGDSLSRSPSRAPLETPDVAFTDLHRNVRSPYLSPACRSPDNDFVKNAAVSQRISTEMDRNMRAFLSSSSVSTSPDRGSANDLNRNVSSPLSPSSTSTSPDRAQISLVLNRTCQSPSLSSASTSPSRAIEKSPVSSPVTFGLSNPNTLSPLSSSASSSPARSLDKSADASPRTPYAFGQTLSSSGSTGTENTAPPPPPPPPPPPLPPPSRKRWDIPVRSESVTQLVSQPPALVPPSRPFMTQNVPKVSQVELAPSSDAADEVEEAPKPKLKPLHWDKVRASSDREMVWDHLRSSSFKLNEEMIETLFVVKTPNTKPNQTIPHSVLPSPNQENRVLEPKKAQNIAILLRALNVTVEEVCEALSEGNTDTLGPELLESLLKMAPTKEEEYKLKEYKDDSLVKLGPAEKFLKAVLDVPFAFKRVDAMLYITNFDSEVEYLRKSFETLEAACEELRNSRMFLKLLEAVLKTGNRMNVGTNRGDAHAFKLDTLLKLVDVKGADGKTTLLHFVVQEIIKSEGARLSNATQTSNSSASEDAKYRILGLQVVSGLSSELTNVKKAAAMDSEVLSSEVSKLSTGLGNINEVLGLIEKSHLDESSQRFSESMNKFMQMAEEEIIRIQAEESLALTLVKEITEYFHGNSAKEEAHPFRIFMVVRDFLTVLDRVCKEVGMINERTIVSSAHKFPVPVNPMMPQASPGFHGSP